MTVTTEQKVITVANDDESINGAISAQNGIGWTVTLLVLSIDGSNMTILFTKTDLAA